MEIWDVYTKEREKTDMTVFRGEHLPRGFYRICVLICIFNSSGEMLIQHRTPNKERWPGMWDISAGGSAVSGDTSASAASRELFEELGISHDFSASPPAMSVLGYECFIDIYLLNLDVSLSELTLQAEEVDGAKFASRDEIMELIHTGEFIPYSEGIIDALFFMRNHRGVKHERPLY